MAFETSEQHSHQNQRPVRVPALKGDIYNAAVEMAEDLDGWEVLSKDEAGLKLTCRRPGGFLKGTATIKAMATRPNPMRGLRRMAPSDLPLPSLPMLLLV